MFIISELYHRIITHTSKEMRNIYSDFLQFGLTSYQSTFGYYCHHFSTNLSTTITATLIIVPITSSTGTTSDSTTATTTTTTTTGIMHTGNVQANHTNHSYSYYFYYNSYYYWYKNDTCYYWYKSVSFILCHSVGDLASNN